MSHADSAEHAKHSWRDALLFDFVFWPLGLVVGWAGYSYTKLTECMSPNLTIYKYCDQSFGFSVNPILTTIFIVLGSIGWITVMLNLLPESAR